MELGLAGTCAFCLVVGLALGVVAAWASGTVCLVVSLALSLVAAWASGTVRLCGWLWLGHGHWVQLCVWLRHRH